ncbi:hypothetical protein VTJ04DRAFT_7158 [Mycothermus thermophilus]|uniref:uncharacterized protein n=1 Tax=Humicola insolens TaxID=85995 RepID=UPI003744105F
MCGRFNGGWWWLDGLSAGLGPDHQVLVQAGDVGFDGAVYPMNEGRRRDARTATTTTSFTYLPTWYDTRMWMGWDGRTTKQ